MRQFRPPRHIVWCTDRLDLEEPFQRRWYIRQVLLHGRAEDIRTLDLEQVAASLDDLDLPSHIYCLWREYLDAQSNQG